MGAKLLPVQPPERSSVPHRVRDPEAIALLRDIDSWRLFTPFTENESSVGEAANQVGVPLRKMYSFVQNADGTRYTRPSKFRSSRGHLQG